MSTYRETRMKAGPSILGAIENFVRNVNESARRREEERRQMEADRERRRRECELAKQRTRQKRERRERERARREAERRLEAAVAAKAEIAGVRELAARFDTSSIRKFAAQELDGAHETLRQAEQSLACDDPYQARKQMSKAVSTFHSAEKIAFKRQQAFEKERQHAVETLEDVAIRVRVAAERDTILHKWKQQESASLAHDVETARALLEKEDFAGVRNSAREILKKLEHIREEAADLERKNMLQTALTERVSDALSEMGFDVSTGPWNPNDPASRQVVAASRSSGEIFSAIISLDGLVNFRLDEYEGEACQADADGLQRLLAEKYDVKMEDVTSVRTGGFRRNGGAARSIPAARAENAS